MKIEDVVALKLDGYLPWDSFNPEVCFFADLESMGKCSGQLTIVVRQTNLCKKRYLQICEEHAHFFTNYGWEIWLK